MGSEAFLPLSLWCLLGFVFYWRIVIRSTLTEYSGIRDLFSEQMKQKNLDYQVHTAQVQHPYVWCDRKT